MHKYFPLVLILSFLSTVACTQKNPNLIAVDSPFSFEYDAQLQGSEFSAVLGEDKISTSQLMSPSPALMELEQRINDIILRKIYSSAKEGDVIVFGFSEPAVGLSKLLDKDYNEKIEVSFDPQLKAIVNVNDKPVSVESIVKNDTLLSRLMQSRFEQSIKALEGLFARRKILEASKQANTTMENYIQKQIIGSELSATDNDVKAFAEKNNISEKELTEKLAQQIKDTIVSNVREKKINEYVAKNIITSPIKVGFQKPTMSVQLPEVDPNTPHVGEGPITLLLFSRWDCENCKNVSTELSQFVANQEKYFKLNYLFNFPINSNEERMVSEAALCLQKQNPDYFWNFTQNYDVKSNDNLEEAVNQAVRSSGGDYDTFRTCFLAREFKNQVEAHLQGTKDLGFYKTPVVVLDGKVIEMPNVKQIIEEAMALKAEKGLGFNLLYKIKQFFK